MVSVSYYILMLLLNETPIKGSLNEFFFSYRWTTPIAGWDLKGHQLRAPWVGQTLTRMPPVFSKQGTTFFTLFFSKFRLWHCHIVIVIKSGIWQFFTPFLEGEDYMVIMHFPCWDWSSPNSTVNFWKFWTYLLLILRGSLFAI